MSCPTSESTRKNKSYSESCLPAASSSSNHDHDHEHQMEDLLHGHSHHESQSSYMLQSGKESLHTAHEQRTHTRSLFEVSDKVLSKPIDHQYKDTMDNQLPSNRAMYPLIPTPYPQHINMTQPHTENAAVVTPTYNAFQERPALPHKTFDFSDSASDTSCIIAVRREDCDSDDDNNIITSLNNNNDQIVDEENVCEDEDQEEENECSFRYVNDLSGTSSSLRTSSRYFSGDDNLIFPIGKLTITSDGHENTPKKKEKTKFPISNVSFIENLDQGQMQMSPLSLSSSSDKNNKSNDSIASQHNKKVEFSISIEKSHCKNESSLRESCTDPVALALMNQSISSTCSSPDHHEYSSTSERSSSNITTRPTTNTTNNIINNNNNNSDDGVVRRISDCFMVVRSKEEVAMLHRPIAKKSSTNVPIVK